MSGSHLTTIAHCFRQIDAALAVSALEAAGFRVFVPHFHISGITPHFAIAFGGIPIQVPNADAHEAAVFLSALHTPPATEAPASPAGFRRGWRHSIQQILFYLLGGSRPPAGLFPRTPRGATTAPHDNEL